MMKPLASRRALVTGARGIGAGVARCLARDGADVALVYRRDEAAAEATAAEIRKLGQRAETIQADLRVAADCERAAQTAVERLGGVDILVHNAGSATRGLSAVDTTDAEYLDAMELHCLAAVRLTRALASQLRSAEHANVVIVTSSIAAGGGPGIGPYHAAKAAAEAFAHTLAHEERANGIRVNIVRPGFTDTDMGRRLAKSMTGSDDLRRWDAAAPFGRVGRPEDIGNVIAFLCSEGGAYVTNQVICVDGGQATIGGATDVMMRTGKPA